MTMKRVIYGTILTFVAILIIVAVIASQHEVVEVEYKDGAVVEMTE